MADAVPAVDFETGNGWDGETAHPLVLMRVVTSETNRILSMPPAVARRLAAMLVASAETADAPV